MRWWIWIFVSTHSMLSNTCIIAVLLWMRQKPDIQYLASYIMWTEPSSIFNSTNIRYWDCRFRIDTVNSFLLLEKSIYFESILSFSILLALSLAPSLAPSLARALSLCLNQFISPSPPPFSFHLVFEEFMIWPMAKFHSKCWI